MPDDFGYLNARIRSRRSQLLPEGFFRQALGLNFPELVRVLSQSIYGPDLTGHDLSDIDSAVTVHLGRTVADLPRLVSGEAREAIDLLLMEADLANVKTILRGKSAGWTVDEIKGHLVGGTLPRGLYSAMVEAPDPASLAQVLALPNHLLARALRVASRAGHDQVEIEILLDQVFYATALRRASELEQPYLANFISFEIDASNLSNSIKLFTIGFEGLADRFFLKGGRRIGLSLFRRLSEGEMAALQELSGTDFGIVAEVRDLPALERRLGCAILAKAREEAKDVLGAGLAIDYIKQKEWEAGRIRLLARRAYYNLQPDSIEQEVFCQ